VTFLLAKSLSGFDDLARAAHRLDPDRAHGLADAMAQELRGFASAAAALSSHVDGSRIADIAPIVVLRLKDLLYRLNFAICSMSSLGILALQIFSQPGRIKCGLLPV